MTPGRVAWAAFALVVALSVATTASGQGDGFELVILPFATVGALLAARRPGNPIGRILLVAALAFALSNALRAYADSGGGPSEMPGGELALWADEWLLFVWLGLVGIFVPLLFPDGRLPSRALAPGGLVRRRGDPRRAARDGLRERQLRAGRRAGGGEPAGVAGDARGRPRGRRGRRGVALALATLGALWAVVVRLRRARGVERQQVKWFAAAMAVLLLGLTAAGVSVAFDERGAFAYIGAVGWGMFLFGLLIALPAAVAIAILRHRLYDIDLVINRALVYGALTILLAGAYVGLVLLLGLALSPLTSGSDLAIALSTLVVAALFLPLRGRMQALVDRRFYRRKYDAARTLERFGARLRSETDLEALRAELTGAVAETMQPAHVSLWLRGGER